MHSHPTVDVAHVVPEGLHFAAERRQVEAPHLSQLLVNEMLRETRTIDDTTHESLSHERDIKIFTSCYFSLYGNF